MSPLLALAALLTPLALPDEFLPNQVHVASSGGSVDRILAFASSGLPTDELSQFTGTPVLEPSGLAFGPDGLLYMSSLETDTVEVIDADGAYVGSLGAGTLMDDPRGLAFGPRGRLHVANGGTDSILVFEDDLQVDELGVGMGLDDPVALAFTPEGHLLVTSLNDGAVHEIDASGVQVRSFGETLSTSNGGLALADNGRIYVGSLSEDQILVFDASGELLEFLGSPPAINDPLALLFAPDEHLLVLSAGDDRIVDLAPDGSVLRTLGVGILGGTSMVVSPFRFPFSTKGDVVMDGLPGKLKQGGVLTVTPGSNQIMLDLEGDDDDGLVQLFDSPRMVFAGSTARRGNDKMRTMQATFLPADPDGGLATLVLEFKGKPDKDDFFEVKRAKGSLIQAAGGSIYTGSAKTNGKPLK